MPLPRRSSGRNTWRVKWTVCEPVPKLKKVSGRTPQGAADHLRVETALGPGVSRKDDSRRPLVPEDAGQPFRHPGIVGRNQADVELGKDDLPGVELDQGPVQQFDGGNSHQERPQNP